MPSGGLTSGSGYNGHNSDGRHKNDKPRGRPPGAKNIVPRRKVGEDEGKASDETQPYARAEFETFFTPAKRRKVLNQLQEQAEKGHYKSAELLLAYDMGKPAVATELAEGQTMTAEQTRALAEQVKLLLVAKNGEAVAEGDVI